MPRRHKTRCSPDDPGALAARLPDELKSLGGLHTPEDFRARLAAVAAFVGSDALAVPAMNAAGLSVVAGTNKDSRGDHDLRQCNRCRYATRSRTHIRAALTLYCAVSARARRPPDPRPARLSLGGCGRLPAPRRGRPRRRQARRPRRRRGPASVRRQGRPCRCP